MLACIRKICFREIWKIASNSFQFSATFHHHHHFVLSYHSHLHHGKNLNLKLFSRFCLFQAQLNFLSLSVEWCNFMLDFIAFSWKSSPEIFCSSCYSYFFSFLAFAFKKAKRYKRNSIVKAILASLWKGKEKKEIHLSKEIRDDFLWQCIEMFGVKRKQEGTELHLYNEHFLILLSIHSWREMRKLQTYYRVNNYYSNASFISFPRNTNIFNLVECLGKMLYSHMYNFKIHSVQ